MADESASHSADLLVGLLYLGLVVKVLLLVGGKLGLGFSLCFFQSDVQMLKFVVEVLSFFFPLHLIFMVSGVQVLDLVFLDFDCSILLLLQGRKVEFVVLYFTVFVLQLGELLFNQLELV